MNYLSFFFFLLSPFIAMGQKVVINPDWKPGEVYNFKLTYSIEAPPDLMPPKDQRPTINIYNSLRIMEETDQHWLLFLECDGIQLNGSQMDYDSKRRFWKAMTSYHIALSKESAEMTIEGFDQLIVDYLDVLTGRNRNEKFDSLKTELLEQGGFAYMLESDYGFLFKNYLKEFPLGEWITTDSLNTSWKSEAKEKMKKAKANTLEYVLSEEYEKFAQRDTIKNYVTIGHPVFVSVDQSIEYREKFIPVMSNKVIVTEDHGFEYHNLDSGFERKLGKGTTTETIKVERVDPSSR